jgi:uncharacterized protein YjbI with pentapeptide repeats
MNDRNDFWQRPVTDTVTIELVPGDEPRLRINREGQNVIQLELSETRALIEVLNVAVGELFILKKDPAALARVKSLLAEDVTLSDGDNHRRSASASLRISGHVKSQELVRRYKNGERQFPKVDLRLADLEGADLREIDLGGADLTGANLRRANLFYANLEQANLSQANLEEAGLFQTNLRGADLSKANLRRAYLSKAELTDAIVTNQQLAQSTVLVGARLPDGSKYV